ncbi:hypothetical protein [Sphingobacterium sp.]|uniref:hypothetical protein n=1 Tax=Sphingobacterium sp. TaxID=341027 RepID=UPI0028ACFCBE|nr:hypothetical protein [Sphingobacterium sp.]
MLYGNTAQIDITPSLGTIINGEFNSRYASHIADPLFAKAVYLNDGKQRFIFIVVDICVMKRDFLDPLKSKITEITGIPPSHLLISSTHTHSAGSIADLLMGHVDMAYRSLLEKKILSLALKACSKENQVEIAFGKINKPEHLTCRRYKMDPRYSPINPVLRTIDLVKTNPFDLESLILSRTTIPDPELCFIGIKKLTGEWIGLLANYGLHYVGDCERSTITADYFGYFNNKIVELSGDKEMVSILTNGTSGEVNIWDFINGDRYPKGFHEKSKLIGEDLAHSVFEQISSLIWKGDVELLVKYQEVILEKRKISKELLQKSLNVFSNTNYEKIGYSDGNLMEAIYAREQILLEAIEDEIKFPIQAIQIGETTIGGLGGEFFSKTGIELKELIPNYFTICLANDYVGYVPPKNEFKNGGYETWRCRSSFLEENAEFLVKSAMLKMIKDIQND